MNILQLVLRLIKQMDDCSENQEREQGKNVDYTYLTFANNYNGYIHAIILVQAKKNHIQYETFRMNNKAAWKGMYVSYDICTFNRTVIWIQ